MSTLADRLAALRAKAGATKKEHKAERIQSKKDVRIAKAKAATAPIIVEKEPTTLPEFRLAGRKREAEWSIEILQENLDWKPKKKIPLGRESAGLAHTNHLVEVPAAAELATEKGLVRQQRVFPRVLPPKIKTEDGGKPDAAGAGACGLGERISGLWGLDFRREIAVGLLLGKNGVGPPPAGVLYESQGTKKEPGPPKGYKPGDAVVTRWMDNFSRWDADSVREDYRTCVGVLKNLHSVTQEELCNHENAGSQPFLCFSACDDLFSQAVREGVALPEGWEAVRTKVQDWAFHYSNAPPLKADRGRFLPFVLCHNGLSGRNFLHNHTEKMKDRILPPRLVDFTFAQAGDRLFDLASFSCLNGLTPEEDLCLLQYYFEEHDEARLMRFQLLRTVFQTITSLRILILTCLRPATLLQQATHPLPAPQQPPAATGVKPEVKAEVKQEPKVKVEEGSAYVEVAGLEARPGISDEGVQEWIWGDREEPGAGGAQEAAEEGLPTEAEMEETYPGVGKGLPHSLRAYALLLWSEAEAKVGDEKYCEYALAAL